MSPLLLQPVQIRTLDKGRKNRRKSEKNLQAFTNRGFANIFRGQFFSELSSVNFHAVAILIVVRSPDPLHVSRGTIRFNY